MTRATNARVVSSHGLKICFSADEPCLLDSIDPFLPPGSQDATPGPADVAYSIDRVEEGGAYRASFGAAQDVLLTTQDLQRLFRFLQIHLHHLIAENAAEHLFVHAGAVAWLGRAILLPGRSLSGKSELVWELIRAGAVYLSDEFAVLDGAGMVHPFARPLSLRAPEGRRFCQPGDLGAETAGSAFEAGLVAVTEYQPGKIFEPLPITRGEALLHLLENTVTARSNPLRAIRTLKAAVSGVAAIRSPRGEAAPTARMILDFVERRTLLTLPVKGII